MERSTSSALGRAAILVLALAIGAAGLAVAAVAAPAQESTLGLPDEPRNLQVLPESMSTRAVVGLMRGFSSALGVRCIHCHLGDDPRDLSTVDFASDERPAKRKARVMMRMVQAINETHLAELQGVGVEEPLEVRCATCHHGNARPVAIESLLTESLESGGVDALLSRYDELRERYYGGWTYDFSEAMLNRLGERVAATGDTEAAVRILERNLELFPGSVRAYVALGSVHASSGNVEAARAAFQACIEADPTAAEFCQGQIDRLSRQQ